MAHEENPGTDCHLSPYWVRYVLSDSGPTERINAIWAACEASARTIATQIYSGCRIVDIRRENPPKLSKDALPPARFINGQFCAVEHGDEADLHQMSD